MKGVENRALTAIFFLRLFCSCCALSLWLLLFFPFPPLHKAYLLAFVFQRGALLVIPSVCTISLTFVSYPSRNFGGIFFFKIQYLHISPKRVLSSSDATTFGVSFTLKLTLAMFIMACLCLTLYRMYVLCCLFLCLHVFLFCFHA